MTEAEVDQTVSEEVSVQSLESVHSMGYWLPSGQGQSVSSNAMLDFTGVAVVNVRGDQEWTPKKLKLDISVDQAINALQLVTPKPPMTHWVVQPLMWSASAALASIENQGRPESAAFAVNRCYTDWDLGVKSDLELGVPLVLHVDAAVRNEEAYLRRLSYAVRVLGTPEEVQ
ncbi:hypothetical protein [Saccharopolyspora rosea]|uniref:Uncharacterized protein n=1 Tax=Saccharopolyspora rosea TaxID=524884 RepID=A0ABW3FPP9_9PSEU|nr:hypothetical protein [Saccharopolyspora rosea]